MTLDLVDEFGVTTVNDIHILYTIDSGKIDPDWIFYKLESLKRLLHTTSILYDVCCEIIRKIDKVLDKLLEN